MKFNIATDQGIQVVEGEPITIGKWKCFSFVDELGVCSIYEFYSGMVINQTLFSMPSFTSALELLESHDHWAIKKKILAELHRHGMKYPINK